LSYDVRLKIVFMGTPDFAIPVLAALVDAGHDVAGVYTRPDRRAGRGRRLTAPPVKEYALERGLRVFQPASLRRDEGALDALNLLAPDLVVVAAYGLFLPGAMLDLPRLGCLNIHPSLLPRHRGPSPVATAILDGDAMAGVTVIRLDDQMDHGPIAAQRETTIGPDETAGALTARLFRMGAELLLETLPGWRRGDLVPVVQDESLATVTRQLTKQDGEIDWGRSAEYIARQVRAYSPWPGTFTLWRGRRLAIVAADTARESVASGPAGLVTALPEGVRVATGEGVLELRTVQLEGRKPVDVTEFLRGHSDFTGSVLGG
jgi:methionyl-tRNA formyltransferase